MSLHGAIYDSSGITALSGSGSTVVVAIPSPTDNTRRFQLRIVNTGNTDLFYSVDGIVWSYCPAAPTGSSVSLTDDHVNEQGSGFKGEVSLKGNGSGFSGVWVSTW